MPGASRSRSRPKSTAEDNVMRTKPNFGHVGAYASLNVSYGPIPTTVTRVGADVASGIIFLDDKKGKAFSKAKCSIYRPMLARYHCKI